MYLKTKKALAQQAVEEGVIEGMLLLILCTLRARVATEKPKLAKCREQRVWSGATAAEKGRTSGACDALRSQSRL
jgi:hypothetical protein